MFFIIVSLLGGVVVKRSHIKPYSLSLLLLGILIGVLNHSISGDNVMSDSIDWWSMMKAKQFLLFFIPPIIYQACLMVNIHMFKKLFTMVILLSMVGVLVTYVFTSLFLYGIESKFNHSWSWLIGAILSAIDPISITSVLPELKVSEKLSNLIEIESLLNDEASLLIFYAVYRYILYDSSSKVLVTEAFKQLFGSVCLSLFFLCVQLWFLRRWFGDFKAQSTISICFCYFIYFVSEYTIVDTSGILAVMILGLCMNSYGKTRLRPENLNRFTQLWELLSYYSSILIYTVSGLIIYNRLDVHLLNGHHYGRLIALYLFLNMVRCIVCLVFKPWLTRHIFHYDDIDFLIMCLSGLRGEISLALSLIVYDNETIELEIKNLILFYVTGIVVLTLLVNATLVRWFVHYYHRDRIQMNSKHVDAINNHIDKEGNKYIRQLKDGDFHLNRAHFDEVQTNVFPHLEKEEVEEMDMSNVQLETDLFLNTLKRTIWNLFEQHVLHSDTVYKLIDITDSALDNPDIRWNMYMNDYCQKEHIDTPFLCFISKLPIIKQWTNAIVYNRIQYNYNLTLGYIIALKETLKHVEDILDNEEMLLELQEEVNKSLLLPETYVKYLEESYHEILEKIETIQASVLVISKQKSHLEELVKNGEISERTYDILMTKLDKKESKIQ